jgi:hypothetical protein
MASGGRVWLQTELKDISTARAPELPPGQRRPVQGSSPDDRKDYPDFESSQESLRRSPIRQLRCPGRIAPGACTLPDGLRGPQPCVFRHDGIYRADDPRAGRRLPLVGPRASVKGRDGRRASCCSSSTMSSGRLFLDRVARQQCPSPLHRHTQINMHFPKTPAKGDVSTLPAWGHFYFALTPAQNGLTRNGAIGILTSSGRQVLLVPRMPPFCTRNAVL